MPDKPGAAAGAPSAPPEQATPKKGLPIKTVGIVAAIMALEAVGVFFFVSATGHKPQDAGAQTIHGAEQADLDATVEIPLVEDKFQNMQTGRVWVWDAEIVLKVKARNEKYVTTELERRSAEVKEGVAMIFRRAPHSQLKEPGLETVNRQLQSYVAEVLGKDPDGKDRVDRIVIPKCKGFPAD